MTPEEVEILLRRIPELQPPPNLEARLRRPRRFPAWIAIAASVMFFLGIFWLTLRPSQPGKADELRIRIEHGGDCGPAACVKDEHWKSSPAPIAGRKVVIQSVVSAPWGAVRRVMEACAQAGIYTLEWSTPGTENRKIRIPKPSPPGAPEKVILEEIRIILTPGTRRVGARKEAPTLEDLMVTVRAMVVDYKRAGKTEWPISIDAAPDVPWKEVLQVVDQCANERFDRVEFSLRPPLVVLPAGASPKPRGQSAEAKLADVQKELDAGRVAAALELLEDMITVYPESPSTVRAFTRVTARTEGPDDPALAEYRKKWLLLAPKVYDDLLKPLKLVDRRGVIDPAAVAKAPDSLQLYLEQGYMEHELGKNGQRFHYDNATTVFSNIARVVTSDTEMWWTVKYEILATLVDRGTESDIKLSRAGLGNLERSTPDFDGNKYGLKKRFLKLKQKINELLITK